MREVFLEPGVYNHAAINAVAPGLLVGDQIQEDVVLVSRVPWKAVLVGHGGASNGLVALNPHRLIVRDMVVEHFWFTALKAELDAHLVVDHCCCTHNHTAGAFAGGGDSSATVSIDRSLLQYNGLPGYGLYASTLGGEWYLGQSILDGNRGNLHPWAPGGPLPGLCEYTAIGDGPRSIFWYRGGWTADHVSIAAPRGGSPVSDYRHEILSVSAQYSNELVVELRDLGPGMLDPFKRFYFDDGSAAGNGAYGAGPFLTQGQCDTLWPNGMFYFPNDPSYPLPVFPRDNASPVAGGSGYHETKMDITISGATSTSGHANQKIRLPAGRNANQWGVEPVSGITGVGPNGLKERPIPDATNSNSFYRMTLTPGSPNILQLDLRVDGVTATFQAQRTGNGPWTNVNMTPISVGGTRFQNATVSFSVEIES